MKYSAQEIFAEAKRLEPVLRDLRRDFHRHPELGFEEVCTTAKIKEVLGTLPGIVIQPYPCKTGAVAELPGLNPALGTIGLRCDIDALPILEENKHGFQSLTPGKMHACGHDGHITTVLGAAMLLSKFRPDHTVRFLFQPAEESSPDGAPEMIAAGALDNLESVWGFHLNATSDFGKVGYYDGPVMSGGFGFRIKFIGKSGHPTYPESNINPIEVMSKFVVLLEGIKNTIRSTRPYLIAPNYANCGTEMCTFTPGEADLHGRCAYLEDEVGQHLRERIDATAKAVCQLYKAKYELSFEDHFPITYNEPAMGETVRKNAAEFGFDTEEIFPSMGSDDFGYYSKKTHSYYMTFGIRKGKDFPIAHTPIFNFDESILPIAAAEFASCALV